MSSTGTPTSHLGLNQWLPNDKPERADFNSDNQKVDAALDTIKQGVATAQSTATAAQNTANTRQVKLENTPYFEFGVNARTGNNYIDFHAAHTNDETIYDHDARIIVTRNFSEDGKTTLGGQGRMSITATRGFLLDKNTRVRNHFSPYLPKLYNLGSATYLWDNVYAANYYLGSMKMFESGTWTPKLEGATTAGEHTYKHQVGYYTRIGNLVTIRCYVAITKDAAMDGAVRITGLPYSASHFTPASFSYVHYMGTNAATITGFVEGGRINLGYQSITTGNYSNITSSLIGNAVLMCSATYIKL